MMRPDAVVFAAPKKDKEADAVVDTGSSIVIAATAPPDDYYDYMAEMQAQQVFFESMILGLLVLLAFVGGFRK